MNETEQIIPLKEVKYESEDLFQRLIEQYPDILAGDQITPDQPRKWIFVSREMGVPEHESGGAQWFLDHLFIDQDEQGERSLYCERVAPGETEKTCRLMGARAVFEKKIQDEDTWKLYKRAYKKYYARFMKGNMSREEFKVWAEQAAEERDDAIQKLEFAPEEAMRLAIINRLKEKLNDR